MIENKIKMMIGELNKELISLRRDFHMHPELGFEEFRSSEIIIKYLENCGIGTTRMAHTGVFGLLKGNRPGKTLLLRADIDALPIEEDNDVPYKSVIPGKMHACGHDGHTAILLVAAKVLSKFKEEIFGNIKFVFQPNEEDAGAYLMIEEGIMDNPKVDAAVGMHLWSILKSGQIDISAGPVMAASHYFYLTIKGKGGHAGFVNESIDPISTAADIIQSVQTIQTRKVDPLNPLVIMFTKINAGSNTTIVPEIVELEGSIRFLYQGGEEVLERFKKVVDSICKVHGAEYEIRFKVGNNMLVNNPTMVQLTQKIASEIVSKEFLTSSYRTMGGDDFADFAVKVPSVYYFIGVGNEGKKTNYPHHHSKFNLDEDVLKLGVEMHVKTALTYLQGV